MQHPHGPLPRSGRLWPALLLGLVALIGAAGAGVYLFSRPAEVIPDPVLPESEQDVSAQVYSFCAACHPYSPADTFPRFAWKGEVERAYTFFGKSTLRMTPPPIGAVVKYYEDRAPVELPPAKIERATTPLPVRLERYGIAPLAGTSPPAISNVQYVRLAEGRPPELLACEMRRGHILAADPRAATPAWRVLGMARNPARVEVVDLDGDGIKDVLVADLGNFVPTDDACGRVLWLRGRRDGTYAEPLTLLKGVGRVADVRATDFDGDGKLDLIVASFGWHDAGSVVLLHNRTTDWKKPAFESHTIDPRHGTIHVPVADLDGDGRPDFVALFSQEHEEIVAFLNQGGLRFTKKVIYRAPHPAYGSSGIDLVDLDGDSRLDVLYTNGDVLDDPHLLKPYHSVQWLRNPGPGKYPYEHRPLAPMYGVHRAVAADIDGDGDLDILAVSFLPEERFPQRAARDTDAIILLEQTAPGRFTRHRLAGVTCDHVTCIAADVYGSGRADLVTANFRTKTDGDALVIYKNLGRAGPAR